MASIGENIKRLRVEAGMSQAELARRINKSRSAVSQYESGEIIPRMGVIENLAAIFMVKKIEIIGEKLPSFVYIDDSNFQDERNLLLLYRCMSDDGKEMLMDYAKYIQSKYPANTESEEEGEEEERPRPAAN